MEAGRKFTANIYFWNHDSTPRVFAPGIDQSKCTHLCDIDFRLFDLHDLSYDKNNLFHIREIVYEDYDNMHGIHEKNQGNYGMIINHRTDLMEMGKLTPIKMALQLKPIRTFSYYTLFTLDQQLYIINMAIDAIVEKHHLHPIAQRVVKELRKKKQDIIESKQGSNIVESTTQPIIEPVIEPTTESVPDIIEPDTEKQVSDAFLIEKEVTKRVEIKEKTKQLDIVETAKTKRLEIIAQMLNNDIDPDTVKHLVKHVF